MTPPREPRRGRKSRREAQRDELSERLGSTSGSEREERRRLVEQEREAYRETRGRRRKPPRARLRLPRLRRPKLRRPKLSRPRPKRSLAAMRKASVSGLRATVERAGPATGSALGALGRGAARVAALLLRLFALGERLLSWILAAGAAATARTVGFLDRHATPERVLLAVIGGAAGCLAVSQFVAYRGVDIGRPDYSEVSAVAPPPQTAVADAGEAHAYVLVPLAVLAMAIAVLIVVSRRWQLGRLVAAVGLVGILISLAIDLPKGLDAGTAGVAFAGAKATMKEGFYVQLAASAALVVCGLLLGRYVRGARSTAPKRTPERRPRPRRAPSVAGGGA
jgi:hypothetical protein